MTFDQAKDAAIALATLSEPGSAYIIIKIADGYGVRPSCFPDPYVCKIIRTEDGYDLEQTTLVVVK